MIPWAPLVAGRGWWMEVAIPLVVGFIYLVIHVLGAFNKRPPAKVPRPDPRLRHRPGPVPGDRQELNDEVSDFLRRAADRRGGGQPAGGGRGRTQPAGKREPIRRRVAPPAEVVEAQAVDDPPSGAGVAAHVKQHLDTREFAERASQLTQVDRLDVARASHRHQVFDHQVGQLATRSLGSAATPPPAPGAPPARIPTTAEAIAALLASPQGAQSALVLGEILRRPDERW